ncbi:probable ribose-5-phosphate isomerase 4, chloroplastic isoform X2 [Nymphaea colorata]|uniref:probable ribose-5-phosphate isomerase 4, chloroplastic isoform X2 n=1 Tax=Nymphaea colorata TaxID=210225 RepID=UPI00129D38EE|nr:probable ribose-5-phosphate isomerase 4, chloroplastic isoform X2 [Nymphaea colorata]
MASTLLRVSLSIHVQGTSNSCRKSFKGTRTNYSMVSACMSDDPHVLEAAKHAVNTYVKSGMVVGLGTGRASTLIIKELGQQLKVGNLKDIVGVPMSTSGATEAAKAGVPLDNNIHTTDFAFDDADAIEEGTVAAVIGRRKLQESESIILEKAGWMETAEQIDDTFLGDAEVWRRSSYGHAGPLGGDFPLVTKEGHNILDVIFTSPIMDLAKVAKSLEKIDGVVDHGIIYGIPCRAVIASRQGLETVTNLARNAVRS